MFEDDENNENDDNLALFNSAADAVVDIGNRLAEDHPETDPWALADGLVAGAVHYWLYAHQPQDPPESDDLMSARERIEELIRQVRQSTEDSDYLHSPHDDDVGRA